MRQDIEIHINTGDVTISRQNTYKKRDFSWVENSSGLARYVYGEVDMPSRISESTIRNGNALTEAGFYFTVPYTPTYKEIMLRVARVSDSGTVVYLMNQTDGTEWFTVRAALYGGEFKNVYASQLQLLSEEGYYGRINGTYIDLYSCAQSDFNIVEANRQNSNCLLACVPSNNYRYPISGVGLRRWINSNSIQSTSLAERIQEEFEDDGVSVITANYNYDTQQLELELNVLDSTE